MPIFIKYDGIEGTVKSSQSAPGGGPRVYVYDGSDNSGGILVSRIALPNSSAGAIDALAPNAVAGARALFEAQRSMVTTLGVVFTVASNGANTYRHINNLRQIGLAAYGQIATLRFFITDGGNQTGVMVELENCLITSYSLGGHGGGAASAGEIFKASLIGAGQTARTGM